LHVTAHPALVSPAVGRAARAARVLAFAALAALGGCSLQSSNTGVTREQGEQIITELKELRRELAEQRQAHGAQDSAPAADAKVAIRDSALQAMGAGEAPVTLVEFTDYQCPYCKRFHDRSWPELKAKYVDTGKVRYVVRDLPLNFHPQAMPAAIAARCAGQQGQFWPVHEALFNGQEALSAPTITATAKRFGVALEAFERCRQDPRTQASIEADVAEAEKIGVSGTPGFVLGARRGATVEGVLILGSQPTAVFSAKIDALLAAPAAPAS
jgi:protein-disulfide isomerase